MDSSLISIIVILVFLILLASGTPIFASLGMAGIIGILLLMGPRGLGAVPGVIYDRLRGFTLVAVPLFILMGEIIFIFDGRPILVGQLLIVRLLEARGVGDHNHVVPLKDENQAAIEAAGGRVLTCQHAFGGVGRAIRKKLGTYEVEEIIAYTLRLFGEGMKVAVEIALMAADAGLVRTDEPAIAIAGTGKGADTAVVLKPANAQAFFDLQVLEILCKPRLG